MKKALIFALSFALACTLAACGDTDSQTGSTSTDPADTSTTENTPEPADTTPSQDEDNSGTEKFIISHLATRAGNIRLPAMDTRLISRLALMMEASRMWRVIWTISP